MKFFGDGCATQYFAAFEDYYLAACPGKITGAHQAIVAATDDNDIVRFVVGHCAASAPKGGYCDAPRRALPVALAGSRNLFGDLYRLPGLETLASANDDLIAVIDIATHLDHRAVADAGLHRNLLDLIVFYQFE